MTDLDAPAIPAYRLSQYAHGGGRPSHIPHRATAYLGARTPRGEALERDRVRDPAVDDRRTADPADHGVEARGHLGNHPRLEARQEPPELGDRDEGDERGEWERGGEGKKGKLGGRRII